jgi:hypothetical protein
MHLQLTSSISNCIMHICLLSRCNIVCVSAAHATYVSADIDYSVFTDAARYVAQGQSPFLRSTYRYSPLLAYILLPNVWLTRVWGKVRTCSCLPLRLMVNLDPPTASSRQSVAPCIRSEGHGTGKSGS